MSHTGGISCPKFIQCLEHILDDLSPKVSNSQQLHHLHELLRIGKHRYKIISEKLSFIDLGDLPPESDASPVGALLSSLTRSKGVTLFHR